MCQQGNPGIQKCANGRIDKFGGPFRAEGHDGSTRMNASGNSVALGAPGIEPAGLRTQKKAWAQPLIQVASSGSR